MASERRCLIGEFAGARRALQVAKEEMKDVCSHELWRQPVDHDCAAEYDFVENAAEMRRDACLIESYDRMDYLQRAGRW